MVVESASLLCLLFFFLLLLLRWRRGAGAAGASIVVLVLVLLNLKRKGLMAPLLLLPSWVSLFIVFSKVVATAMAGSLKSVGSGAGLLGADWDGGGEEEEEEEEKKEEFSMLGDGDEK